jgi:hypothetical protein
MKNLLLLISASGLVFCLGCANKPVDNSALPGADTTPLVAKSDILAADSTAVRSETDTARAGESNPAPSMEVKGDTVKHMHEHGSPDKAKDDSIKAAKTKGKYK